MFVETETKGNVVCDVCERILHRGVRKRYSGGRILCSECRMARIEIIVNGKTIDIGGGDRVVFGCGEMVNTGKIVFVNTKWNFMAFDKKDDELTVTVVATVIADHYNKDWHVCAMEFAAKKHGKLPWTRIVQKAGETTKETSHEHRKASGGVSKTKGKRNS